MHSRSIQEHRGVLLSGSGTSRMSWNIFWKSRFFMFLTKFGRSRSLDGRVLRTFSCARSTWGPSVAFAFAFPIYLCFGVCFCFCHCLCFCIWLVKTEIVFSVEQQYFSRTTSEANCGESARRFFEKYFHQKWWYLEIQSKDVVEKLSTWSVLHGDSDGASERSRKIL